ncbi:MAG: hypothetical protein IJA12_05765 [Oscillospiraceae bacterium]|nr:hypothetical protein [Oscillospiraceae bacterium]
MDYTIILKYLRANYRAYGNLLTRMDVNQDKVISNHDTNLVLSYNLGESEPATITSEVYNDIHDSSEIYIMHDYEEHNDSKDYERYSLLDTIDAVSGTLTYGLSRESVEYAEYRDHENLNTVQIKSDGEFYSGFIVDEHVVATSAAAVMADWFDFKENIVVRVYDEEGSTITDTYNVRSAHVPERYSQYLYHDEYAKYNKDYALLYIEEDLSEHGIWSLGYMTDNFKDTNTELKTNSFTQYAAISARYYSKGNIVDYEQSGQYIDDNKDLRFKTTAYAHLGKSGAPVYYELISDNVAIKSVVGICTNGDDNDYSTWGVRMTPTLARFYLSNPNMTVDDIE